MMAKDTWGIPLSTPLVMNLRKDDAKGSGKGEASVAAGTGALESEL